MNTVAVETKNNMGKSILKSVFDGIFKRAVKRDDDTRTHSHRGGHWKKAVDDLLVLQRDVSTRLSDYDEVKRRAAVVENLLMMMGDNLQDILLWVKDEQHRYVWANNALIATLHPDRRLQDLIGKTDADVGDRLCNSICFSTDKYVADARDQCHFIEIDYGETGEPVLIMDVYKRPVFSGKGRLKHTVGYALKHKKDDMYLNLLALDRGLKTGEIRELGLGCYIVTGNACETSKQMPKHILLGDILIDMGLISKKELEMALFKQVEARLDFFDGKSCS